MGATCLYGNHRRKTLAHSAMKDKDERDRERGEREGEVRQGARRKSYENDVSVTAVDIHAPTGL